MVNGVVRIPLLASDPEGEVSGRGVLPHAQTRAFLGGPREQMLATAVEAICQGNRDYNPFVLYGPRQVGKTHVALGLVRMFQARWPAAAVVVVSGRSLPAEYASGSPSRQAVLKRQAHRRADLLVVEDADTLAGKPAQGEVARMLDAVIDRGGQVVVTLGVSPDEAKLQAALTTRLQAGLVLPLGLPELAVRLSLLGEAASLLGLTFEPDALQLLADSVHGTVPQLYDILRQFASDDNGEEGPKSAARSTARVRQVLASGGTQRVLLPTLDAGDARTTPRCCTIAAGLPNCCSPMTKPAGPCTK